MLTADLEGIASQYEGALTMTRTDDPGGGRASDYLWHEDREFSIAKLGGDRQHWLDFVDYWRPVYASDLGYDRIQDMIDYISRPDFDDPIIVVQWSDGKFYLWDGTHRTACSVLLGRETIPAIVGVLK